jgi:hypothetical protein
VLLYVVTSVEYDLLWSPPVFEHDPQALLFLYLL